MAYGENDVWRRRRSSVSLAICSFRNAITSSRKNTQDFPIRVPGKSPLRASCITVVDSALSRAAASVMSRVSGMIMAVYESAMASFHE